MLKLIFLLLFLSITLSCVEPAMSATATNNNNVPPQRAEDAQPLPVGQAIPDAALKTIEGEATTAKAVLGGKPTVLVFYRGGWCPYCNTQLSGLRTIMGDLAELGFQLIAVSPDSPQSLNAGLEKTEVEYQLVSDSSGEWIRALGIAFELDPATRKKYLGFGVDLEQASGGETHHLLPVPSVYIVDEAGMIQFQHSDPDYAVRMDNDALMAAAQALAESRSLDQ